MNTVPAIRAAIAILGLTLVTLVLLPAQWLAVRFAWPARRAIPVLFHRMVCALIGARVHVRGAPTPLRPLLVAANHVSWLDIPVLGSRLPLSFVAKSEVASWPLFGTFARLQRSVFVDRQRRSATGRTASEIGRRLSDGDAMVLFAEGTSSDGNQVLPFRSALIGAARHALVSDENDVEAPVPVWIQPLAITYVRLQGLPMGRRLRPRAAWYGAMDLAPHLWALLCEGAIDVEIAWGEPVAVEAGTDRKQLAGILERAVRREVAMAVTGRRERVAQTPAGESAPETAGGDGVAADAAAANVVDAS